MDKGTNKKSSVTITNEKGRLSQEEIEKMVKEAEKYKEEDDKVKERVDARNNLESYAYSVQSSLDEEKLKSVASEEEIKSVTERVEQVLKWLEDNYEAEKERIEEQRKGLEELYNPIITKAYQQGGGVPQPGADGSAPNFDTSTFGQGGTEQSAEDEGPPIQEVD